MADSRITGLPVATTFADTDAFVIDAAAAGNRQISGANLRAQVTALRPFQVTIAANIFTVTAGSRATRAGLPVTWGGGTVAGPVVAGTTWLRHTSSNTLIFAAAYETLGADDLVLGRVVTTGAGVSYVFVPFDKSGGDMLNANNLLNLSDKSVARTNLKVQSTYTVGTAITGAGNTPITVLDTTMNGFISYAVSAGVGGVAYTRTVSIAAIAFEPTIGAQLTLQFTLPGNVNGPATIEIRRDLSTGALLYSTTSGSVGRVETVILRAQTDGSWFLISAGPEPHAGDARLTEDINTRAPAGAIKFDGTDNRRAESSIRGVSIGTGDFTAVVTVNLVAGVNNAPVMSCDGQPGGGFVVPTGGFWVNLATGSYRLGYALRDATGNGVGSSLVDLVAMAGRTVQIALSRRAGVCTCFVDGNPQAMTPPTSQAQAITGDPLIFRLGSLNTSNGSYPGRCYSAQFYNRALTGPELRQLAANGVAAEDRNATGELFVNGDFSSATGWNVSAGSSIAGGTLNVTTANAVGSAVSQTAGGVVGRRYLYRITASGISGGFLAVFGASGSFLPVVNGANSLESIWTGSDSLMRLSVSGGPSSGTFDDASLIQIGCLVDLDCGAGSGFSLPDIQGRFPAVVVPTAYANIQHVRPSRRGQFLSYVSAIGNTQIAGLPVNARISSIVAQVLGGAQVTYSIGNATAGSQIVAAVLIDSAAGRVDAVLVNRYTSTGNLFVNLSAASPIMLTISYDIIG